MKRVIIGVMGPGRSATESDISTAYELGRFIAKESWIALSGGMGYGVMDAVSCGAKAEGGLTIGIIPNKDFESVSAAIDIPIMTDMGSARNNINVLSSHLVIAIGMSSGTASEVALALKAHRKVILLNVDQASTAFFQSLSPTDVVSAHSVLDAIAIAKQLLQEQKQTILLEINPLEDPTTDN
ncbi:cytochrome [Tumidithrix helvetica PCC 7403]|uniref:SLOG cluster 4 domain-containing protein n=1 Tax=Tumidithrix helvetica TaxID=3457545 RepID=UPI003C88865D